MNNEPVAYACQIVEADFETNILKIEMLDENYKVSAGIKYLCDTHPVKEQELLGEIAQLKHMNKNWAISEGWLLKERDKLKAELDTANKAYMWMDETYKGNLAEIEALKDKLDEAEQRYWNNK